MISEQGILYIEPLARTSAEPVIDELTRKMAAAFRVGVPGPGYRGVHVCACGVMSSNCDYTLPSGEETNSLCVHYLAFHRDEIPTPKLEKVRQLSSGEVKPTEDELKRSNRSKPADTAWR